jgi:glyceraldehyde-3-phosphate dehydrogenase (NADP+)
MAGQKKVTLELGGNGAVIIHADADLDWAAARCAFGGFLRAGQACISVQRIYVHQTVYDPFVAGLVSRVRDIAYGDPLDAATDIGPMIDEDAARRAEGWIQEAAAAGASICVGGERVGRFLQPTVLADVADDMRVSCEEVFAPIVTVVPYTEFDEALRRVNDTPYGLQAGLFCNDLRLVYRAYEELQVGGVIVNDVNSWRVDNMPYGGVKASGYGREGVKWAIEELTEPGLVAMNVR